MGQDTDKILKELSYSDDKIKKLYSDNIV